MSAPIDVINQFSTRKYAQDVKLRRADRATRAELFRARRHRERRKPHDPDDGHEHDERRAPRSASRHSSPAPARCRSAELVSDSIAPR